MGPVKKFIPAPWKQVMAAAVTSAAAGLEFHSLRSSSGSCSCANINSEENKNYIKHLFYI